jgi:hypothetical protein
MPVVDVLVNVATKGAKSSHVKSLALGAARTSHVEYSAYSEAIQIALERSIYSAIVRARRFNRDWCTTRTRCTAQITLCACNGCTPESHIPSESNVAVLVFLYSSLR